MMRTAALLMAFVAGQVFGLQAPIEGYAVKEFVWAVEPFNNGTTIHIPGTVQEVRDAILKINPGFVVDAAKAHGTTASKRSAQDHFECGPGPYNWEDISTECAESAADYLYGIAGQPVMGPGPGECGRVSCDYAGIWWCNDNTRSITLPSFSTIADCANAVIKECQYWDPPIPPYTRVVVGQRFDLAGWNCIVRRDDHCND